MRSVFLVLFLLVLCVMAAGLVREYIYKSTTMTWSEARLYCRQNYVDLATITTAEENQRIMAASGKSFWTGYCWIGLYRSSQKTNTWWWSDGEMATYFNWGSTESNNPQEGMNCVALLFSGWINTTCLNPYPFFCYRTLILVQESMTWEEALQHCRTFHTDLYCPISNTQINLVDLETAETQTLSVWMGLRFLDGQWFWLNGWPVQNLGLLPSCPAQQYRCGARSTETQVWENRDCNEKLNFLCY